MSNGNLPRDEAELEAFLARRSTLSTDYDALELVEPPAALDEAILAAAKAAAQPPAKSAAQLSAIPTAPRAAPTQSPAAAPAIGAAAKPAPMAPAARPALPRTPVARPDADEDDTPRSPRPRWLVPAALAASVLVAVGVGLTVFLNSPSGPADSPLDGSLFAKRARERGEADKSAKEASAAASGAQDAQVVELQAEALPPPPVFESEGPQVQDLDAAIALIRKELVLANQMAAIQEEARATPPERATGAAAGRESAAKAGSVADAGPASMAAAEAPAAAPAATPGPTSVIQPRDRRLTKILELYDGGNPDLAADSLEIFLRDFEDDPVSQRILAIKP